MSAARKTFLAVDLGASGGRVLAGHFDGERITLEEASRFPNSGVELADGWHWEAERLFENIKTGLTKAARLFGDGIISVAVDTWGVDYGLLDQSGELLNPPWMYRDSRTDKMVIEAERLIEPENIWNRTGIQPLFFNTLFQLMAESRAGNLEKATDLLFMPDLLNYWLSGERAIERTIASTSQMLSAGSEKWDFELAQFLGIPSHILRPTVEPGIKLGMISEKIATATGLRNVSVATCGSHDTASAVAGIPSSAPNPLFLSSGTWSLLGRELNGPVLLDKAYHSKFSNEQGLEGTTRFLKNIAGMWLLQECKREWDSKGEPMGYGEMVESARRAQTNSHIDPDAGDFNTSCDMPKAITDYLKRTGQPIPADKPALLRTILESLALKYRATISNLRNIQPDLPDTLHIVGGGSQNALLNQMTADATGLRVVAGPVEATAAGNVMAQMIASGEIASMAEGREILKRSFQPEIFEPQNSTIWEEKAAHFDKLCSFFPH